MVNINYNSAFPDQVVPEEEKMSKEYGLKVAQAIEGEWFKNSSGQNRFLSNFQNFNRLRLYARGEQPVQKYKDELAINGDLSYLNLDWKPVPILSKFVDIVVNGMTDKGYEIKSYAQDPFAIKQRTNFAFNALRDIQNKDAIQQLAQLTGKNFYNSPNPERLPNDPEELDLYLQLNYKQSIEIAEEEVINNILDFNKYDETKKRLAQDLTILGIGCVKTNFNLSEGITVDYVNPANIVYSYTDNTWWGQSTKDQVQVLYFEYKTYHDQVFKIKQTDQGLEKTLEKPDTFNPPPNDNFERVSRSIEVLYTGAKVLGLGNNLLEWRLSENMTRPFGDTTKVNMNYVISSPRMYQGWYPMVYI